MFLVQKDGESQTKFLSLKRFTSLGTPIYFHKHKTIDVASIGRRKVGNLKDLFEEVKR